MNYGGEVTCQQCWDALESQEKSQLIDVRTIPEWNFVGLPDVSSLGKEVILVEWQQFPTMQVNQNFQDLVSEALESRGVEKDTPVFLICRSGVRSRFAAEAVTALGFSATYNVRGGFEGDADDLAQRGKLSGWKFDELPWRQS